MRIIATVVIVMLIFTSVYFYAYRKDPVNQLNIQSRQEIVEWLLDTKSINQNIDGDKNEENRSKSSELRKITSGLDDDWEFLSEDWQIHEVNKQLFLIEYNYVYENLKTSEQKLFNELYFYDSLSTIMPVPLKSSSTLISGGDYSSETEKTLWNGDFDVYCRKPLYENVF